MMTKTEARQLWRKVERECATVRVDGFRRWGRGSYELAATDTITGGSFVIRSQEDWQDRCA